MSSKHKGGDGATIDPIPKCYDLGRAGGKAMDWVSRGGNKKCLIPLRVGNYRKPPAHPREMQSFYELPNDQNYSGVGMPIMTLYFGHY